MANTKALKAIYDFYDKFLKGTPLACKKGCATCCTTNVSVTSLEVEYILDSGLLTQRLGEKVREAALQDHFVPSTTINTSAAMCLSENQMPEETSPITFDPCPLLTHDGLCSIYQARPFSCRAMNSETLCTEGGEAFMAPFLVTVNLAMYQILEHIDSKGWYGNLLDMVTLVSENREGLQQVADTMEGRIKTNRPLPCFIIPPDETMRFKSFMRRLSKVEIEGGKTVGDLLPENWQILS